MNRTPSVKDEHRADCAIQAWAIGATLSLTGVELAHVDTTFVYPGGGNYRAAMLAALIARVVDLKPLTERYYCHPAITADRSAELRTALADYYRRDGLVH